MGLPLAFLILSGGCGRKFTETTSASSSAKSLYVASGLCYSGAGVTTYTALTASRVITTWNTDTGVSKGIFADLNNAYNVSINTVPQAMVDKGDSILLLTENATTMGDRKIFKIKKSSPNNFSIFANDPLAFGANTLHITRTLVQEPDGSILFNKSLGIERLNSSGVRIVKGGVNPWVNPAGVTGNCFTAAASLVTQMDVMNPYTSTTRGKLIYLHSGNTAVLNRIGIVQRTGLTSTTVGDCAGSSPVGGASTVAHTNATPLTGPATFVGTGTSLTSMVYIPTSAPFATAGKLIVANAPSVATAFDNSASFNHGLVMWDVNETSDTVATLTNPYIIWRDESVVFAPTAMAYDASTSSLYVAVGGSVGLMNQTTQGLGYNVEKFTLDITNRLLTRVMINQQPFIQGNANTRCISGLLVAD